jgi:hypothetical protein
MVKSRADNKWNIPRGSKEEHINILQLARVAQDVMNVLQDSVVLQLNVLITFKKE